MKRIAVPVDFSAASENACQYAAALAEKLGAELDLLHVLSIGGGSTTLMNWKKLEDEMVRSAEASAKQLMASIKSPVKVHYHQASGHPVETVIQQYVKSHKAEMIVIGTHGATGVKKALMGSNAASVINTSSVPVVAVPDGCKFKGIKHIVYATSMIHLDEEIKIVSNFARNFDASISVVHVAEKGSGKRDHRNLAAILNRMADYDKVHFTVTEADNIAEGVKEASAQHHADLIAMFTHELSMYEKIFGKGVTRNVAFGTERPLLSYKS